MTLKNETPPATPNFGNLKTKIIRDKHFAKRLELAIENHSSAPSGHGRQKWLRDRLGTNFSKKVSAEAVRKWFSGEARPVPSTMTLVARALDVDEAWLSLDISPIRSPVEKRKLNSLASGAVNLVAGQILLAGGNIAFPQEDENFDIVSIIKGKYFNIGVRYCDHSKDGVIHIPVSPPVIIVVTPTNFSNNFRFFRITPEAIEKGNVRGDYIEISTCMAGDRFIVSNLAIPEIVSFDNLQGVAQSTA